MPSKTNSDRIGELERIAATLTERIDNVRDEMIDRERFAVAEERINELKKTIENKANRYSLIWASIIAAVVGSVITTIIGKFVSLF